MAHAPSAGTNGRSLTSAYPVVSQAVTVNKTLLLDYYVCSVRAVGRKRESVHRRLTGEGERSFLSHSHWYGVVLNRKM